MFKVIWTLEAEKVFTELRKQAKQAFENRKNSNRKKSSKQEGLYKQINKTINLLSQNPRHNSLATHRYFSLQNPFFPDQKIFEAYVQNNTPLAYRVFWCYGPAKMQITIISITQHP